MEPHEADRHPFGIAPNRTLIRLSVPVLFSLVAEPMTGLVDTAFVARLGADALAGLGVGTIALSSFFWIFNFLGIGTQTEVAHAAGAAARGRAAAMAWLSIRAGLVIGTAVAVAGSLVTGGIAHLMGASGTIADAAGSYMMLRWVGAPAMLAMLGAFGALRGIQDMKTPLWIALGINALNIALDPLLIFGWGPVPAFGIGGAAAASSVSQWAGAVATFLVVRRKLGRPGTVVRSDVFRLLSIGADLFIRTGMLSLFLLLATRAATKLGAEPGAAHQAVRQIWVFTALFLDAWAISAQSLVGFYAGAGRIPAARRVAAFASGWSLVTGVGLGAALWAATPVVSSLLVPPEAAWAFESAWWLALVSLPLGALTFATDGIHWGTGDFGFLRNATTAATVAAGGLLMLFDAGGLLTLSVIWGLTLLWVLIRALLGILRVWPGIGAAPLAVAAQEG